MIRKIFVYSLATLSVCFCPLTHFGQAPVLGTAADFVLFSANGAVSNTGLSHLTGHVGTNNGSSTAFGNVDGTMHDADGTSARAAADLLKAYNQLNATISTNALNPLLGNGQKLNKGVYEVPSAATLNLDLTLDAQQNPDAVFIIRIKGAFATNAAANVQLVNGAQACHVFWQVEGVVSLATGTKMKGTIVTNNAAVTISTGTELDGRILTTGGAITISGTMAHVPVGCGSLMLTGPQAPHLGTVACYGLFTANGSLANTGITRVNGDVGSNTSAPTGFNAAFVTGTLHLTPDNATQKAAADLLKAYAYVNTLAPDIQLVYPAQFGSGLVLTPHTYLLDAATTLTDTVVLNAQGNPSAVFVFKINGALSTSTQAHVKLINGAVSKNVFWLVTGAVDIETGAVFRGTIICHNGAISGLKSGVTLDGRALTTSGALNTAAITTTMAGDCTPTGLFDGEALTSNTFSISPNPFRGSTLIQISGTLPKEAALCTVYNQQGTAVLQVPVSKQMTILTMTSLPQGMYFYSITNGVAALQSGRLVSE